MSALCLITAIVLAGAVLLWVGFVRQRHSLASSAHGATRLEVQTADGWVIHAYHRAPRVRLFEEPVVLCHGFANDFSFLEFLPPQNVAQFLTNLGFDTYSIDHRGDRSSRPPDWFVDATFDDLVQYDIPAILKTVVAHSKRERVLWVGHSLGGLLGLVSAAVNPTIAAICTIGSPFFFRMKTLLRVLRVGQWLSPGGLFPLDFMGGVLAPLAGLVKADKLGALTANVRNIDLKSQTALLANGTSPLWRGVLRQLEDWARHDAFRSVDGTIDYRAQARALQIPVLVVAGTVDQLAPLSMSREYYETLTTSDKVFVGCGREYGHVEDYGHGDLIIGRLAHREVYPVIGDWLMQHATAMGPL